MRGTGAQRSVRRLRVNIPAGVKEEPDQARRQGRPRDAGATRRSVRDHASPDSPVFKRVGENLEVEVPLTIPEAIQGAVIEVPTLNGSKRLRVPPGTKHGTFSGCGARPPRLGGKGQGDLRYRFVIDVPSSSPPSSGSRSTSLPRR